MLFVVWYATLDKTNAPRIGLQTSYLGNFFSASAMSLSIGAP
jgi:hypothetical protein